MKISLLSLSGLVGATLCLGGCQQPPGPGAQHAATHPATHDAATVVGDADTGKTVNLHRGDAFTVRLAGNATTGYGWRTKERKGDSLATVGKQPEYVPDPAPPGVVGSGGHDLFRFKAKKPGAETLRFVYIQPQRPDKVAKEARFRVVVQ